MQKFLNKWTRKAHRWFAIPTVILIPLTIFIKFGGPNLKGVFPPQMEQFQSLLMLTLAITGAYLFLVPYITKWQRDKRQRNREEAAATNREDAQPVDSQ